MKTNTIKTMQYILADVQEFCHDNIDKLYQHSVEVQHFNNDAIYIDATIVEKYNEQLVENKFHFASEDEEGLETLFDEFRLYVADYYKRNNNK